MKLKVLLPGLLCWLGAALAAPPAPGPTKVYRCGTDGKTFSQTPCPAGSAVEVSDPRTPAQQQQARDAAQRQGQLGADLERQRRERERAAQGQRAISIGPVAASSAALSASRAARAHPSAHPSSRHASAAASKPVLYKAGELPPPGPRP